jgi:hypothetical protein
MKKIYHTLQFVTEVDETHPTAMRLLELSEKAQVQFLETMLKEMVAPALDETLEEINAGGTWAILKVAE